MSKTIPAFVPSANPETVKEGIYDKQIAPLVQQMIQICMDNGIHMLMDFNLGKATPESDTLRCTSVIPGTSDDVEGLSNDLLHNSCMKVLKPSLSSSPLMLEITAADGSKTMVSIVG